MSIIEHGIDFYRINRTVERLEERNQAHRRAHTLDDSEISATLNRLAKKPEMQELFRQQLAEMKEISERAVKGMKDLPHLSLQSFGLLQED